MDTSAGVYRIYAQNERESTRTHTYGCEKCLTPSRSYGDSLWADKEEEEVYSSGLVDSHYVATVESLRLSGAPQGKKHTSKCFHDGA